MSKSPEAQHPASPSTGNVTSPSVENHTPEPWELLVSPGGTKWILRTKKEMFRIAECDIKELPVQQIIANGHLLAAAPRLLRFVLVDIVRIVGQPPDYTPAVKRLLDALEALQKELGVRP